MHAYRNFGSKLRAFDINMNFISRNKRKSRFGVIFGLDFLQPLSVPFWVCRKVEELVVKE
jgi:hypothetical protein